MCRTLNISRSSYYQCLAHPISDRERLNTRIITMIKAIYSKNKGIYGYRKIHSSLKLQNVFCSQNKILRLMKKIGITAKIRKKYKTTTKSNHHLPIAKNIVCRNFKVNHKNKIWVSDITYIATQEGWIYLNVIIDLYSRMIVGWSIKRSLEASIAIDALIMAIRKRQPKPGLIFHFDRGVQYASKNFQSILTMYKIIPSMSRKGDCYDNAAAESFFHLLKTELIRHNIYKTREEAKQSIFQYIEVFYNKNRLHSTIGYNTPMQFEMTA